MAPQAGDECIVIFANDSWYRVIRSNDPNLEKIKHPRHDLNHGIALVGMSLNPARPDRERSMREAPSPKEGVLEISNGESCLSLNESGEIVLKNGKGSITLTAEGQISLKREGQPESRTRSSSRGIEIMDTMSQLVAATQNLTTTGSSTTQATSPASKAELDRIQTHFNYVLVKDDEGNETDNPPPPKKITISSGHSAHLPGAKAKLAEDDEFIERVEAVKVTNRVHEILGSVPAI